MGFVEWWKTSSARASADYDALRFDQNELDELRGGRLSATAKEKFKIRLRHFKRLNGAILLGCGVPMLALFIPSLVILGVGILTIGGAAQRGLFGWIWLSFMMLVLGLIGTGIIYAIYKLAAFKRNVAADLTDSRVGIAEGRVDVHIAHRSPGFRISYRIDGTEYPTLNDVIGSEIHRQFTGAANPSGKNSYQTNEVYRFYFLPKSKMLLHYERT